MQTRKRGHKRMYGGIQFSNPFKRAPTQIVDPVDANGILLEDSATEATAPRKNLTRRALASVGSAAGKLGSAVVNGTRATGSAVGTGVTSVGNAFNRFRSKPQAPANVTDPLDAAAPTAPAPSSSAPAPPATEPVKIKPDNLLVPMVINLENNYVLVGSGKFMIKDGNVAKEFIKAAYNKYIEKAKERLAQPNATGDVATVVRQIVFEEFKDIIRGSLINNQLDSAIDYANYANELAMGDLFYKIICVRLLPDISDEDKITKMKSLITPDEIVIDDQSKQLEESMSPTDEAAIESLRTEFAPADQALADKEAAIAASQVAAPVVQQTVDNQNTLAQQAVGGILSQAVANQTNPKRQPLLTDIANGRSRLKSVVDTGTAKVTQDNPMLQAITDRRKSINLDENKSTDAVEPSEWNEGGARSKKTRKRRQKRSKRKTVHYLRKRH